MEPTATVPAVPWSSTKSDFRDALQMADGWDVVEDAGAGTPVRLRSVLEA
jgi:hypothetical protein